MKMMSRKLAMPLLGVLLWVISIHAGTFATAGLLPRPITGTRRTYTILIISTPVCACCLSFDAFKTRIFLFLSVIFLHTLEFSSSQTINTRLKNHELHSGETKDKRN
jgi:CRP-like cAMP-binding protein